MPPDAWFRKHFQSLVNVTAAADFFVFLTEVRVSDRACYRESAKDARRSYRACYVDDSAYLRHRYAYAFDFLYYR